MRLWFQIKIQYQLKNQEKAIRKIKTLKRKNEKVYKWKIRQSTVWLQPFQLSSENNSIGFVNKFI